MKHQLLAQINIPGYTNPSTQFTNYESLLGDIVSRVLLFAIAGAGLYFFYHLITSGFSYMTSFGDEARLKQVLKQLTNALIGLLVVISAFFIMQIMQTITGTNLL